jgi:hypothetical protein
MNDAIDEYHDDLRRSGKASCVKIGRKYNIPRETLYKRVTGKVKGRGVLAGGRKHPRVLRQGELYCCSVNSFYKDAVVFFFSKYKTVNLT